MNLNVIKKLATELFRYDSELKPESSFWDLSEWSDYSKAEAIKVFFKIYGEKESKNTFITVSDGYHKEFAPKGYVGFGNLDPDEYNAVLIKHDLIPVYKDVMEVQKDKEYSRGYVIALSQKSNVMAIFCDRAIHFLHNEKEQPVIQKMEALHIDLAELIVKLPNKKENTRAAVYGLGVSQGTLQLQNLNVKVVPKPTKEQTTLSYPSLQEEKIANFFDDEKAKGKLLLFSGEPGTGKTTYIRQLIDVVDPTKKVILSGPELFANLEKPEFSTFVMRNFVDAYLIIEDAERFLVSRENGNNPISLLLNYTDGLFGDAVNLKVVATFNTDIKNIDKALLRAGRLHFHQHFDTHTPEQAMAFLKQFDFVKEKETVEFVDNQIAKDKSFSLCNLYEFLNEQREKENG